MSLAQTPDRYLRQPRFLAAPLRLQCLAWFPENNSETRLDWLIDKNGQLADDAQSRSADFEMDRERCVRAFGYRGEIRREGCVVSVWLCSADKPDVQVWCARGTASSPALAVTDLGVYIAWHHDVREDSFEPDVAKWIAIRFVDDHGTVKKPNHPMHDRDRDRAGEEQSFEFPALVVGDDGALAIFGRGSHCFWRQDLNAAGFSRRTQLGRGQWGSRGRRCCAARLNATTLLTARRERREIEVNSMPMPVGGCPPLVAATVDWTVLQPEPTPRSEAKMDAEDPASTHGRTTYFGDIQQHSAHSDGIGSADEVYARARYRYGDDFVALTDHESFLGKRTSPSEWEYLKDVADHYDTPGHFATLLAYEWTGKMFPGPGHKCVYVPHRDSAIISRDTVPDGAMFVAAAAAEGMLASPHHIGWTGCDEAGHDPVGQPTWEICSCHGCYEHADHPLGQRGDHHDQLIDVMLNKGLRFGFTASSDSHGLLWHHGESRKRDPYRTGLTAVQVEHLSRESVFQALQERRCYATSGVKIRLDLTVDGHPMGSEINALGGNAVASAVGVSDLSQICLIGPAGVVAEGTVEGSKGYLGARVAGLPYVYLRVVQEDGEMAWSSPIFFG